MGLTTQFLVGALIVSATAVAVAQRFDPLPSIGALGRALFSVFWLTVAALLVHVITRPVNVFGVAHVAYLALVVSMPLASLALLAIGWARLRGGKRRLANLNYGLLAVGLIPGLLGMYGTHVEPDRHRIDRQTIKLEALETPIRIAVLADLQTPNVGSFERGVVQSIIATDPQLILIAGDLWSGGQTWFDQSPELRAGLADLLAQLVEATHHVVIVAGDHDSTAGLRQLASETGAVFLDDEIWRHDIAGSMVTIAGSSLTGGTGMGLDEGLASQLTAIPTDELVILLSHRPDAVLALGSVPSVALVVSGHTHGGQVALPFIGPLATFSDVPRSAAAGGVTLIDGRALYVSSGIGLVRGQAPQVRFGVTPEIGLLTLEASDR